ncbi:cholinephosphate cytidylyltransferase [Lyophyllum atratum]|nr:cholinephosphate cytidylyltransferase [Lyophyllum atratum]
MSVEAPRKVLHSKRSFGKYPRAIDSPAYDASEEDNDPLTDDGAPAVTIPVTRHGNNASILRSHPKPASVSRVKHQLASSLLSDSDGVDSPTYDGDVESSATAGPDTTSSRTPNHHHHHHYTSSTSTLGTPISPPCPSSSTTPITEQSNPMTSTRATTESKHPVFISHPTPGFPLHVPEEPAVAAASEAAFSPAALTAEDIQAFVQKAIDGESWRTYKINPPPTDRPMRVYADGVYDLFHFGHALQLRQAKMSFPSVYLLVGVCSDELVKSHKAQTIMTHAERLEAARHCRWVDEIVPDAPWIIDEEFIKRFEIDYVAHDEDPYAGGGHDDVYAYAKSQGKFIPTRRTPGVSTSELLERIVSGYRKRDFDDKLTKMGHAELRAEGSDYDDSSRYASRRASRSTSPTDKLEVPTA